MSNYRKTMAQAIREMYPINEDNMELMRKAAGGAMQTVKMKDGNLKMDSFTASAIMKVFDKVNPANQKKMADMINKGTKGGMMKLQDFAMKQVKSENDPEIEEEVDLDEALKVGQKVKVKDKGKVVSGVITNVGKGQTLGVADVKLPDGRINVYDTDKINEEVEFDEDHAQDQVIAQIFDEGTKQVLAHGGKGQYKVTKDGDSINIMHKGKVVGTADFDRGADSFFVSIKGEKGQKSFKDAQAMADYFAKNKITEEVDLDEGQKPFVSSDRDGKHVMSASGKIVKSFKDIDKANAFLKKNFDKLNKEEADLDEARQLKDPKKETMVSKGGKVIVIDKKDQDKYLKKGWTLAEESDLDEGKMSQLHQHIKDKKSAEEIAKIMGLDVKTIKSLMSSHHPEDVEESAASDARRAMAKDKDFSRKDSADDDDDASDDDIKGASKNIMMQLRKAQSLKGRFDVEFADGKKVKVSAPISVAVQQKYNAQKRPADKEKFQARIGKSYKDMLSALKEELQPKKESILERMNRKIKENKHG